MCQYCSNLFYHGEALDGSLPQDEHGTGAYNLNGVRWEIDPLVHQVGSTVTWSIATTNFLADYVSFDAFITNQAFEDVIRAAFDAWELVTNIDFIETSDSASVDVRIGYEDLDGAGGTLGVANYSWDYTDTLVESFISFDLSETWHFLTTPSGSGTSAYLVALHEIGHVLGIGHSSDSGSVMAPYLNSSLTGLTQDDILAVQAIYGVPETGNQAPSSISLTGTLISENALSGTLVGFLSADDPDSGDSHTFEIITGQSGPGAGNFEIVGDALVVSAGATLDFETRTSISLAIRVTDDGGLWTQKSFTINLSNVAISDVAMSAGGSITENAGANTFVARFEAFEQAVSQQAAFTLIDDANGLFVLDGNTLRVAAGADIDYETATSHTVRIAASDGGGPAHVETFTIQVANMGVSDIALMSGGTVAEDAGEGVAVASFQALEGSFSIAATLTLIDDANGLFVLDGSTLRVAAGADIDYETATSHTVRVAASDGSGPAHVETFTIQVANAAISDIALLSGGTVIENAGEGVRVALFQAFENGLDVGATFTLVDDAGGLFALEGNELKVAAGADIDHEAATSHTVRISASDGSGAAYEEDFSIRVVNTPISDVVLASGGSVTENAGEGTVVAGFQARENTLDVAAAFTLLDDAGGLFILDGNTLRVAAGSNIDYETATSHTVMVSATDGSGAAHVENFTIQVTNMAISDIALSSGGVIVENSASGSTVATFEASENPVEPTATFSLINDANGLFVMDGNTLRVAAGAVIDYELDTAHTVRIAASDGTGPTYEEDFIIQVVNAAVSDIVLTSGGSVAENAIAGTAVASFQASEGTSSIAATFTLVEDAGGLFVLDDNTLRVAAGAELDYEAATSHTVRIAASDGIGAVHEEDFTIQVQDQASETVTGGQGSDSLTGTSEDDIIYALADDDLIMATAGSDRIDGAEGHDTVVYAGNRADYQLAVQQNGNVVVSKPGGFTDTLIGIERIDMQDGDYVYDLESDNLGFGYRIYQAAFGRTPDEGGVRFWTDVLDELDAQGFSDQVKQRYVANAFNKSAEFQSIYGSNTTNRDYIDAMYENVLYRSPDQDGYDFWVNAMDAGLSREDVLIFFAECDENVTNNIPNMDYGIWLV